MNPNIKSVYLKCFPNSSNALIYSFCPNRFIKLLYENYLLITCSPYLIMSDLPCQTHWLCMLIKCMSKDFSKICFILRYKKWT